MKRKTKFIYNGVLLTAVGLAMRGTQLLFGAYIARAVGAEGVGINTLVMMVYSFALTFATSGISLTVTRLYASAVGEGRAEDGSKILGGAFLYAFAFGSAANVILLLLSGIIGNGVIGAAASADALRALSFSLIPSALSAVISGYFVAVRRVTLNAITQVGGQLFRIALTVFLLSGTDGQPIIMLALGVSISELVAFLIAFPAYLFDRRKVTRPRAFQLSPVAKMALPLAISAYLRSALLTLEHNLIPRRLRLHGETREEALSSYGYLHGMALPLILYPMTPLTSFSGLLVPEFAEAKGAGQGQRMKSRASYALNTTLAYGIASAVFIYLFSTELGFTVYSSGEAGRYIAVLAPVVPIMYLDHATDAILKGIGEHIYSMWVNIADAVLSVLLVFTLIPVMGIAGYAVVIIAMEAFNFLFSIVRLRKKIAFRLDIPNALLIPVISAVISALAADSLMVINDAEITPLWLVLKLIFAVCAFFGVRALMQILLLSISAKIKRSARS